MEREHRKIELKYFIVKMKQKIDIDYLTYELIKKRNVGLQKTIINFEDFAQIFLDSMIMENEK